jgi:chlorite dismutase
MTHPHSAPPLDLDEHGATKDGKPQTTDRRLFLQLVALSVPRHYGVDRFSGELDDALKDQPFGSVIYADFHHPLGLAVVAWTENPDHLAGPLRAVLGHTRWPEAVTIRTELGMLGRTYSSGYEANLTDWLIERPKRTLLDPKHQYAVWYPLRRKGAFERLEPKEKGAILGEHGALGRAYGEQDYAHDVRLDCHGLDPNDNDFVVGLVGKELYPLSHVVQAMRKTRQTSEFIETMGPFFVGRTLYRNPGK